MYARMNDEELYELLNQALGETDPEFVELAAEQAQAIQAELAQRSSDLFAGFEQGCDYPYVAPRPKVFLNNIVPLYLGSRINLQDLIPGCVEHQAQPFAFNYANAIRRFRRY